MKKILFRLTALLTALLLLSGSALASVSATPNQKLYFRTGPNTKYAGIFTLPQSTALTAIEYESGNGVTWVLVEFTYKNETYRGYTGLKRMTVNGQIPWASHDNLPKTLQWDATVYSGPGTWYHTGAYVYEGDSVTLLRCEGDYAFIEFYDYSEGCPSRGWVAKDAVDVSSGMNWNWGNVTPSAKSDTVTLTARWNTPMYGNPANEMDCLMWIPAGKQARCYGYLFNGKAVVEYGGMFGYVYSSDFYE